MFAEDERQPEVETQPGDDSQCKNNGGKEQATKKQYMEAEYDTGGKVPEKLDTGQYINDTNVTAEIKYALTQNRAPPVGFKFPPKEYKDKRYLDLSKDTANTAGSQTLTLYHTLQDKMHCIAQHVCCFTQKARENNQVCLLTSHASVGKTFKFDLQNHSHIGCQTESPHTCSHHQKFHAFFV